MHRGVYMSTALANVRVKLRAILALVAYRFCITVKTGSMVSIDGHDVSSFSFAGAHPGEGL